MPKFRSRPVEIEAWQYDGNTGSDRLQGVCICDAARKNLPHLHTMHEGQIVVISPGDWIVREPTPDRYYPIKPDVFAKKYEPV